MERAFLYGLDLCAMAAHPRGLTTRPWVQPKWLE
eukprot:CAMPEP_0170591622 /NCGR_PEP_ID=MMETSP0224-20130122/12499_1 /TAXON_ID=285029 /ORGANISM="Togula jolla, Strain CCCM 725" /LENGTH=33 /DNA_ID= /DNA_START= /DNA_END= /DNA_ORIENTATION=